ncbi:MAG: alpha/beta fold hydrolase [Deltaproteobacteria bacterium]|nr:MAG: alpha/beta fold hydrolase [Deltaproteobacteria bacterium]
MDSLYSVGKSILSRTRENVSRYPRGIKNLFSAATKEVNDIASTPRVLVGKSGRASLYKYNSIGESSHEPILLVPSLINRYYILDLYPGCSLIESLVDNGHDVYLLEWLDPRPQDIYATMEDHILSWMNWAVDETLKHATNRQVHLFGQCMGGTFSTIYTAINPEKIKSLVTLTAPVDFCDDGLLSTWARESSVNMNLMEQQWGMIHHEFLQQSFKVLKPTGVIRKWDTLLSNSWKDEFVHKFCYMERWINDNVSFPAKTYTKYINELYRENRLANGTFTLNEQLIDLSAITCPVLCFTAKGDDIVPPPSAELLIDLVSSKKTRHVELGGGHIGCVVSNRHQKVLWSELDEWLLEDKNEVQNVHVTQ